MAAGSTRRPRHSRSAPGQKKPLKDDVNGLQIELGRNVEHGEILVVERLGHRRGLVAASEEVGEEGHLPVEVARGSRT